ncbi:MAG TPA: ABC transporter ATP-binding protein [Polyangiaceae bacterium]|jgi:nitrate/nitrite transport system ATP-binding protein|nr:ABC transporter ATP-binding protein [Polyangiaceae bacterium]
MPILELDNACKSFGSTKVLANVSLSVEPGEFVAIVGFSGAGKSTLMSLLSGLAMPDTGAALYKGKHITGPGPERGVVFQNYSLLPWLTAFENVRLSVDQVFKAWSLQKRNDHVERYLNMVGLSHARDRRPAQLSGGMRQRVALARALATEPEVLLMDEPLGALDALTRATLQDELERISRLAGKTIVLVTNDVDEAILLADRIIPLSAGPSATLGPATEVSIARPRDRKRLNHEPLFRHIRVSVVEYLLDTKRTKQAATKRPPKSGLLVPAMEPSV